MTLKMSLVSVSILRAVARTLMGGGGFMFCTTSFIDQFDQ